eukprot:PhM_4_TR9302/c0_g1_i1/m.24457
MSTIDTHRSPDSTDGPQFTAYVNLMNSGLQCIPRRLADRGADVRRLCLHMNEIRCITEDDLSAFRSLVDLDLSSNHLTDMSPVYVLTSLTRLNLSGNSLVAVPPGIGRLVCLEVLTLNYNRISDITALSELGGGDATHPLHTLSLCGNNVDRADSLSALRGMAALRHLHMQRADGSQQNAVCRDVTYRSTVMTLLPRLETLDDHPVGYQRSAAATSSRPPSGLPPTAPPQAQTAHNTRYLPHRAADDDDLDTFEDDDEDRYRRNRGASSDDDDDTAEYREVGRHLDALLPYHHHSHLARSEASPSYPLRNEHSHRERRHRHRQDQVAPPVQMCDRSVNTKDILTPLKRFIEQQGDVIRQLQPEAEGAAGLRDLVARLREDVRRHTEERVAETEQLDRLRMDLREVTGHRDTLQTSLYEAERSAASVNQRLAEVSSTCSALRAELAAATGEREALRSALQQAETTVATMTQSNTARQREAATVHDALSQAEAHDAQQRELISKLSAALKEQRDHLVALQTSCTQLQRENSGLEDKLEAQAHDADARFTQAEAVKQKEVDRLKSVISELEVKVAAGAMLSSSCMLSGPHCTEPLHASYQHRLDDALGVERRLRGALQVAETANEELRVLLEKKDTELRSIGDASNRALAEADAQRRAVRNLSAALEEREKEVREAARDAEHYRHEAKTWEERARRAERDLGTASACSTDREKQLEADVERCCTRLQAMNTEYVRVRDAYVAANSQLDTTRRELEAVRSHEQSLEHEVRALREQSTAHKAASEDLRRRVMLMFGETPVSSSGANNSNQLNNFSDVVRL